MSMMIQNASPIAISHLIWGGYNSRATFQGWAMSWLPLFILLVLLGWRVFGPPLQD
jgi:hypothetical protein